MSELPTRVQRLRKRLEAESLEGWITTHPSNLRYLFGFTGSSGLGWIGDDVRLLVDSRYVEQATAQAPWASPQQVPSLLQGLRQLLRSKSYRIGFNASRLSYDWVSELKSWSSKLQWIASGALVEEQRMIKDPEELATLGQGFQRAQRALATTLKSKRPGETEIQMAARLEYAMRREGSQGIAFDTIVASGPRSALPHGVASNRVIQDIDLLLIDFGLIFEGYNTDLTRIELMPKAPSPSILELVREAGRRALATVRPGATTLQVDTAARDFIREQGYGEFFGHGLGHGLGLEVHELPQLSPTTDQELLEGMVFTIEPGIYLPGRMGVRLEDVVVVTRQGFEFLSQPVF